MPETTETWPGTEDWAGALAKPTHHILDEKLSGCSLEKQEKVQNHPIYPPYPGDGAVVFRMLGRFQGRFAVKLWNKPVRGRIERYKLLEPHWPEASYLANWRILPEGIRLIQTYPALVMDWLSGMRLDEYLVKKLLDPHAMERLLQGLFNLSLAMETAEHYHGDLRPDNMLVTGKDDEAVKFKLVDYDSFCVGDLDLPLAKSYGRAEFQHPVRRAEKAEGRGVDRFAFLVMATAIAALKSKGGKIWARFGEGEGPGLLFRVSDFLQPGRSELLGELMASPEKELKILAEHLVRALSNPWRETATLCDIPVSWAKAAKAAQPKSDVAGQAQTPTLPEKPADKSQPAPVTAIDFSPDGRRLVVGYQNGLVQLFDRRGKQVFGRFEDHPHQINGLVFSSNGQMIYTAGMDRLCCAWDWVQKEVPWRHFPHEHSVTCIARDSRGDYLLTGGGDGSLLLRKLPELTDTTVKKAHRGKISGCYILPNLVVSSGVDDGQLRTWDIHGLSPLAKADVPGEGIAAMDVYPRDRMVAVATHAWKILFYEANTLKKKDHRIDTEVAIQVLKYTPKGKLLAAGCADGSLRVWQKDSGKLVGYLMIQEKRPLKSICWLPGGTSLLVGTAEGKVRRYSLAWLAWCLLFKPKIGPEMAHRRRD